MARMLWKEFGRFSPFRYYQWEGEFGDVENIISQKPYYCQPDKPCELLAHSGNLAVVRMNGKRFILFNQENMQGIILPCKSKVRDPWQILADWVI